MKSALANFQTLPLKDAARQLLARLGCKSDKYLAGAGSSPLEFLDLFASGHAFDPAKALVPDWISADLLFQLTDADVQSATKGTIELAFESTAASMGPRSKAFSS